MAESVLYTVIPVVYFTGLMALGFRFNRRNRSRQEYFLARGDLGPATLGFSYSATQMSGSSYMGEMPALWVVSSFLVWGFFQIGGAPAAVTRFLIPKDRGTLRKALVFSIAFSSFIYIGSTLIAIASGVLLPDLEQTDLALPTLVQLLMHPLFGGILVAAVLGATMSTIDSVLLLASSLVVENLYVPMARREVSQRRGVRLARWTTLGIGVLALVVVVDPPATILFIVTMSFSLMASAFTFPLLLGMWWPRATRAGGLAGMVGGAVVCVLWYVLGYVEHGTFDNWIAGLWPALVGPAVSLVLLVGVSLVTRPPPGEVVEVFFGEGEGAQP